MKKTKLVLKLLLGLLIIAMGVLIVVHYGSFIKLIVICAGISAVLNGITSLKNISTWKLTGVTKKLSLIDGILTIAVGVLAVVSPLAAASAAFTVIMVILAVDLIVSAAVTVESSIVIKRIDKEAKVGTFLLQALLNIAVAVLLLVNPEVILVTVVKVIGGVVIGLGICSIIWTIRLYRIESVSDGVVVEEIVEENASDTSSAEEKK